MNTPTWEEWKNSEEGASCLKGTATGEYLENRLWRAFTAGRKVEQEARADERRKTLETVLGVIPEQYFVEEGLTWGDSDYDSNSVRYGLNLARENVSALLEARTGSKSEEV